MDYFLEENHSFINYYNESSLCMYGRLQIIIQFVLSKLEKYGYTYEIQPQTVLFMKEELFSEIINHKNISIVIYELCSIQDSILSFRSKKNKIDMSSFPQINKEIYHIYRHIIRTIDMYKTYLNNSRTDDT